MNHRSRRLIPPSNTPHGTLIRRHRRCLDLTVAEYAVIARCSPVDVKEAEAGRARLPDRCGRYLAEYSLGPRRLAEAPTGPRGRGHEKRGDPWKDIPDGEHARANACVAWFSPMNGTQIAAEMGITRQRVDQIEKAAFARLRRRFGEAGIVELLRAAGEERDHREALGTVEARG